MTSSVTLSVSNKQNNIIYLRTIDVSLSSTLTKDDVTRSMRGEYPLTHISGRHMLFVGRLISIRVAGDSDFVWEKFLPSDYSRLISRLTDHHRIFSSKKELYRCLCDSILIDNGTKIFKIEKLSGKISYVISARDLSITWSDQRHYWSWTRRSDSRFSEGVELIMTDWLEINGKIRTGALSPNTSYGAYLIMKVTARAYGLDLVPAETSITVGNGEKQKKATYLSCLGNKKKQMFYREREQRMAVVGTHRREPEVRDDGWMEIELGEFDTVGEDDDKEVVMSLTEVKGYQLKGGIAIDGIEVRPKPQK